MSSFASFDGIFHTLKRARKDLVNLKRSLAAFEGATDFGESVWQVHPKNPRLVVFKLNDPRQQIGSDVGIITNTLWSALGQLIYSLYELEKGEPPPLPPKRRLQFPVCKRPEDFRGRIKPDLEGLNVKHIALIEGMQPYNGGNWLLRLKVLAEEHRHRKIIDIRASGGHEFYVRSSAEPDIERVIIPGTRVRIPKAMNVQAKLTGRVIFPDGAPVIETLEVFQLKVADVIDAFKPLFDPLV